MISEIPYEEFLGSIDNDSNKAIITVNNLNACKRMIIALANNKGGIIIFGDTEKQLDIKSAKKSIQDSLKLYSSTPNLIYKIPVKDIIKLLLIAIEPEDISKLPIYLISSSKSTAPYYDDITKEIITFPKNLLHDIRIYNNEIRDESPIIQKFDIKYDNQDFFFNFIDLYNKNNNSNYSSTYVMDYFMLRKGPNKTLVYAMSFGLIPQIYYPGLIIEILNNITGEVSQIDGSIKDMYNKALLELKKYIHYELTITKDKCIKEESTFSIQAIKKILFNALTDRSYNLEYQYEPIHIILEENKIEFKYPGGPIKFQNNEINRNPSIKTINSLILSNDTGPTDIISIIASCTLRNYKKPLYINKDGNISITIYRKEHHERYFGNRSIDKICEFCQTPKSKQEIYKNFFNKEIKDYKYFNKSFLTPLVEAGVLELTMPDKTSSKLQKFVISHNYKDCKKI